MVADLIDHAKGEWRLEVIDKWFNQRDAKEIQKIAFSSTEGRDQLIWHYTRDGNYYAKSGYMMLINRQDPSPIASVSRNNSDEHKEGWKKIWELKAMPNVKNFIWKSCHNALSTNENLQRIFKNRDKKCARCGKEDESIEHILFFCNFAKATWAASGYNYKPRLEGFGSIKQWWDSISSSCPSFGSFCSISLIAYLLWQIWKERNDFIFEGKSNDPIATWIIALNCYSKFQNHLNSKQNANSAIPRAIRAKTLWNPPPQGYIKVNCYASFDKTTGKFGIAALAANHEGNILGATTDCISALSIEAAEAHAIRAALRMAIVYNYDPIIVESDCKNVINRLMIGATQESWETAAIERDIKAMANNFMYVAFNFICREGNTKADNAAKKARFDEGAYLGFINESM